MGCQFITQRVGDKERRVVASQLDMARFFTPYDKGLLKNSGQLRDVTKIPSKMFCKYTTKHEKITSWPWFIIAH